MSVQALLSECESVGISVSPLDERNLWIDPIERLSDQLRDRLVANKPEIIDYLGQRHRVHIHRVLVQLRDIKPYRINDTLRWRGDPTIEQGQLLAAHRSELLEALTPRPLTKNETETLASWLHDIGENQKVERDAVFDLVNGSPKDRVALLWRAEGSPL